MAREDERRAGGGSVRCTAAEGRAPVPATGALGREGAASVTVTVGSAEVTALPSMVVPIVVAVPAVWPVKVASYVPSS